jgi:hypothetical protein
MAAEAVEHASLQCSQQTPCASSKLTQQGDAVLPSGADAVEASIALTPAAASGLVQWFRGLKHDRLPDALALALQKQGMVPPWVECCEQ